MYLADAIKLKHLLLKQIDKLLQEVERVAFIELEKDEPLPTIQSRSLEDIEVELQSIRTDMRRLDRLVCEAHLHNVIETNDGPLPLVEAIEFAVQLRAQARMYQDLAERPKREFQSGHGEGTSVIKHALYDPELYRLKALDVEKRANRISSAIDAANHRTEIDFDASRYM
ncbi:MULTISPECIES: hypothetical protein [Exiguobacterium]|uniref:hypothetical protein n=1 Tax=Exiguobacterium TaxID=33986 RepID=UPI000877580A|nr:MULTISPECIES: hypothetical protein [Exiguobacterium]TCI34563.1 hypothetical protein EVJ29_11895 [Exiguobacterium sp. SH4S7]TCI50702.1 hypothetical protein EVJ24_14630 [Exiguobacterium sp. SH1S21]TCI60636.1 hypothetical protein EVJ21_11740 [Exiguobacterium sp. SH0S2]TCI77097.1 hypothetical protein EVJ20_10300 [Exiguobacterium sp. SH0S1]